jgi:hypothetical protein
MRRFALTCSAALVLVACQKDDASAQPESPAPAAKPAAPAPAAAAKPAPAPKPAAEAKTYTVRINTAEVAAGKPATTVIEISPGPGFKMNLEFPTKFRLEPKDGISAAKPALTKDDAELNEEVLRFPVGFTAAAAGKHALKGVADFSVCNDTTCKLIRGETFAWEIDAQ